MTASVTNLAGGQRLFIQRRQLEQVFIGAGPDAPFARPLQQGQWLRIVRRRGAGQALKAYRDMVAGRADAQEGWMLDMQGGAGGHL